jgi:hypothetical protein
MRSVGRGSHVVSRGRLWELERAMDEMDRHGRAVTPRARSDFNRILGSESTPTHVSTVFEACFVYWTVKPGWQV